MQRTTIMLSPKLKDRAQRWAQEKGISLSELIRDLLFSALEKKEGKSRAEDPLFSDEAVFTGEAPIDLAEHHDRYLYGNQSQ